MSFMEDKFGREFYGDILDWVRDWCDIDEVFTKRQLLDFLSTNLDIVEEVVEDHEDHFRRLLG